MTGSHIEVLKWQFSSVTKYFCHFPPFVLQSRIRLHWKKQGPLPTIHVNLSEAHLWLQIYNRHADLSHLLPAALSQKPFSEIRNRTSLRGKIGLFWKHLLISKGLWCNGLGFALDHEALSGFHTRTAFILFYFLGNPASVGPHAAWISLKYWHMSLSAHVFRPHLHSF